jgi:oligopeptide transport system permease protein
MGRYVLRRLLQMVPVVIGTTFLIFMAVYALPGDPFAGRCGDRPCPESYIARESARLNLDDPVVLQYLKYLWNLLQGDLGETLSRRPVIDLVTSAYQITLKLALIAIVFELVIGILAGVLAGLRRGSFLDNLVLVSSLFVVSIPVFVIGATLQLFLGVRLEVFPVTVGAGAPWSDMLLPGFVLGSLSLAYVARLTRSSLAENLRSDYVRTAVAKGLPRSRVIGVHTLRNSLIPVITFIGADFGTLLGGAVVTEGIFNIRGVGGLIFTSIVRRENATVVAVVTLLVLVFLLVNLIVDLLYGVLDPRIRHD